MAAVAKHLATVTLELGGKSPVIVDEDADVKKIAGDLAAAKQFNGGQACICPDYVFVNEQQKNGLVEEFRAKVKQNLYRDDGSIKKENIAQIVNDQNFAESRNSSMMPLLRAPRLPLAALWREPIARSIRRCSPMSLLTC